MFTQPGQTCQRHSRDQPRRGDRANDTVETNRGGWSLSPQGSAPSRQGNIRRQQGPGRRRKRNPPTCGKRCQLSRRSQRCAGTSPTADALERNHGRCRPCTCAVKEAVVEPRADAVVGGHALEAHASSANRRRPPPSSAGGTTPARVRNPVTTREQPLPQGGGYGRVCSGRCSGWAVGRGFWLLLRVCAGGRVGASGRAWAPWAVGGQRASLAL